MGQQFGQQISEVQKQQLDWVPRAPDVNGGGGQGMRLVGYTYGVDTLFAALAITDTAPHASLPAAQADPANPTGTPFDPVYGVWKTAFVQNGLNQAVSLQPTWSLDGIHYYPFGSPETVAAGATAVLPLSTSTQYVPYVGLVAQCSTAPTSGALTVQVARLG